MKTRYKALIVTFLSALLIITALYMQSFIPTKVKPVNTQTNQTFDKLPPGLAPAVANALDENLPESYHIKKTGKTYQADNESHGMRYAFTANGPIIQSSDSAWTYGMTLKRWGYEGELEAVPSAELAKTADRVEYKRDQALTEWYKNTAFGLEQGFTLNNPPAVSKEKHSHLTLEIAISGTVTPKLEGKILLLQNKRGETLSRYTGLYTYDSKHKELPSRMVLADNTLSIVVDDSNAAYPITIDPWVQKAILTVNGGSSLDNFARSVAVYNDTVVVGASTGISPGSGGTVGLAYVFEKPENGWSSTDTYSTILFASDRQGSARFGCSVDIYYHTILVGAREDDTSAGETDAGSAYVFEMPGSSWSDAGETMEETVKLMAPSSDRNENDQFGYSVAIGSDIIVVGAHLDDHETLPDDNWGAAYVFEKTKAQTWADASFSTKLVASDRFTDTYKNDQFGISVDVRTDGDAIVVGARNEWLMRGAAYVFEQPVAGWSTSGTTTETAKLTCADYSSGAIAVENYFGESVAINSNTVVVGAWGHDIDCDGSEKQNIGAAYVFEMPISGWSTMTAETAKLTTGICTALQYFGESVAVDGDTIVVSARGDNSYTGAAYVFKKPDSGWTDMTYTSRITARDGATSNNFAQDVAVDGYTIAVGAPGVDSNYGAVYIFKPSSGSLSWMIPLLLQ